jgi:energy-coupling factor transport system permease protein
MSFLPEPLAGRADAPLARVAGVTRLTAGAIWLVAATLTTDPLVPAVLCLASLIALWTLSGLEPGRVARRFGPVFVTAIGLSLLALVSSSANADAAAPAVVELGPLRITGPALAGALALGLRLVTIALVSVLVFGPGDPTGLADSLVQQWRVPDRFAYGTIAALGLAPILAADWTATGAARRLRGLEPVSMGGRVRSLAARLLVLLVSGLRRAQRMALAMDARGFDAGVQRSRYRLVRVGLLDLVVLAGAVAVAVTALALAGR